VNASQLIYDGAKTSSQVKSATESLKASRYGEESVSVDTRYALRAAFVQLLTAQKQVALAEQIMTKRKQNLRLIELLYKSGTENIGSLSKARADLAEAEYEVPSWPQVVRPASRDRSVRSQRAASDASRFRPHRAGQSRVS